MVALQPSSAAAKSAHRIGFSARPKASAIRSLHAEIDALIQSTDTNLVQKELRLRNLQAQLYEFDDDLVAELQTRLIPVYAELSDKAVEHKGQQKWLQLGFSQTLLSTHADCVDFLMRSGLAFSIAMFKEATTKSIHDVLVVEGEPMIRMQGEFVPWFEIKQKLELNKSTGQVIATSNPAQVYTYYSPDGIVKGERTPYPLYPIEILTPEELKELQEHAKGFEDNPLKTCILQVVTTSDYAMSPSWLADGINEVQPKHTSIRLVDDVGRVYSLGLEIPKEFEEYVREHPMSCMAAGYAKVGTPDYRDTRSFDEKLITTIPVDSVAVDTILAFANSINKSEGIRFSITKQNCNTFGVLALGLAGITVDTRVRLFDIIGRMMPKTALLDWLKSKVSKVVAPLFSWLKTYTPPIVKKTYFGLSYVLGYVPKKLGTLFTNSVFLLFGGQKEAQKLNVVLPCSNSSNNNNVISFSSVIPSWSDVFDDDASLIVHPYRLVDWQKEQKTTVCYGPSAIPKMHLLPKY